jgi:type IV pilus assembly protein PilY1
VPVLVFGAGYDAAVDDLDPTTITAVNATTGTVTTAAGTQARTMGRGIFVVNALTGALIWRAGGTGSGATKEVAGMIYAIPSDISVIRNESGGFTNRAYVGDTGGNVWRIDFKSDTSASQPNLALTTVTKLASLADQSTATGRRKFLFPPDVVGQQGFDAILLGSGDREHPFDTSVTNRFYMLKDRGGDAGAVTGTTQCDPTILQGTITEPACTPNPIAGLSDLTSNCLQDAAGCTGGETQTAVSAKLGTDRGWFITLGTGEKVVGNAVSIAGTTFFNTNQPSETAGGGTCGSNLGVARQYQVATADATATSDLNAVGGLTAADRSLIHAGGGYLPSPVHVVVKLGDKPVEAVISGIQVTTPPGASLSSRLRKYWYREIDSR